MKQITRVQELETLREEAIARIRAVLDLHSGVYQLCDPESNEDLLSAPRISDTMPFHVHSVFFSTPIGGAIKFGTSSNFHNRERNFFLENDHTDLPCILAIADRIDYLEETGIHTPDPEPKKIIRERDTFNPENL